MENQKILDLLRASDSLLEGHFLLTSGKHSDRYCQCAKLLQYPDRAATVVAEIIGKINTAGAKCDMVLGPAMGGIVIGYELARQLGTPGIFSERENGNMTLRRGFNLSKGSHVMIAEDVVTTGKSTLEAAAVIESFGGIVVGVACLVDRRSAGIELPFPVFSATTLTVETFDADNCQLCKDGLPIEKPGSRSFSTK